MTVWMGGPRFALGVHGPDAVDLLHRVTSNEVKALAVGASNHQCLLTAKGKIVSLFDLERRADGAVLSGPVELKAATRAAIDRYIIADQVVLEDLPDIAASEGDDDARIRRGEARWAVDIDEETIPYEAGLHDWVSTAKGCYTGQETIARIETYGQVARRLCRLVAMSEARPGVDELSAEGTVIGRLTSVTSAPDGNGFWHALGMIRRAGWPAGTVLTSTGGVPWKVEG